MEHIDLQSFLAWEERQEYKHEFDGVAARAMEGCTAAHSAIQTNLAVSIGGRLRGKACQFYGSDLKIQVAGSIRYPDGFVVCTKLAPTAQIVTGPVVIFEILDETTACTDFGRKNREYAATDSVQRYVILEQNDIAGIQFERSNGDWIGHILRKDAILHMPEIGIALPLIELYEGLELAASAR
jgi:Uma2 family endonuclease